MQILPSTNFAKYMQALTQRDRFIAPMDRFLSEWDAYICPVSTIPAFPHQPQENLWQLLFLSSFLKSLDVKN